MKEHGTELKFKQRFAFKNALVDELAKLCKMPVFSAHQFLLERIFR